MAEIQSYTMNFGPQHPAAHGVLRLVLEMEGEVIQKADPHVGLLHRATEKLAESKPFNQSIGYMDRLDYVSMMCNEHGYVMAIEKLLGVEVPVRAQYIRVMFDEITRILNHLMWLGAHGLDIGAMTMFLYCFREREDLMDCYEAVSGTRMHATYYRPGGVLPRPAGHDAEVPGVEVPQQEGAAIDERNDREGSLLDFIEAFTDQVPGLRRRVRNAADRQPHLEAAHGQHRRRLAGACDAARFSPDRCCAVRASNGTCARSSRTKFMTAWISISRSASTATATTAIWCVSRRCVSRTALSAVRRLAARESGPGHGRRSQGRRRRSRVEMKDDMESLIHHFKLFTEGYCVPEGEAYAAVEHPKGEFGVYIVSDGANKPYRVKIRAPGFAHLSAMSEMVEGHMLADVVAVIGTQDIVFGEVDR